MPERDEIIQRLNPEVVQSTKLEEYQGENGKLKEPITDFSTIICWCINEHVLLLLFFSLYFFFSRKIQTKIARLYTCSYKKKKLYVLQ